MSLSPEGDPTICARCARAADQRQPRDQHCDTACDCQHRTDRYQTRHTKEN